MAAGHQHNSTPSLGICRSSTANYCPLGEYASYSFSSVAFTVAVAPALTVMVLSQVLKPDFSSLILWSPAVSRSDEGVLPMNFSSTVISAPSGADLTSTVESAGTAPVPLCAGVRSRLPEQERHLFQYWRSLATKTASGRVEYPR